MPCNSEYMQSSSREVALSRVACLLDELDGKTFSASSWDGYHPRIYNAGISKLAADRMVADLCSRLSLLDVSKLSLEMQIWWRDHQAADKKRLESEEYTRKVDEERKALIEKLSRREREILGVKDDE